MRSSVIAGLIGFAAALLCAHGRSTPYDNYVLLADAMLHHRLAIAYPGYTSDAILIRGDRIVIEAPLPALLVLPLVAAVGPAGWTQTFLACLMCGLATGAACELARRYGVPMRARLFIVPFFIVGTDMLWCAMLGDVWFIAHVTAAAFTFLALVEIEGKKRGWLAALYAACAFESRFPLVLALVPYAIMLWPGPTLAVRRYGGALLVLAAIAAVHVQYDLARFGVPQEIGFQAYYREYERHGEPMLDLSHVPNQLYFYFVRGAVLTPRAPFFTPDEYGMALTWTSPALVLAFFARPFDRRVLSLWLATLLVAVPAMLYYDTGGHQFGMRHALDFEPFLFALVAIGVRHGIARWARVLVAYSVAVGVWGIVYWEEVYRPNF